MNYRKGSILFALILITIIALALFFIVKNQGYIRQAAYETTETVIKESEEIIEEKFSSCGNGVCENVACMAVGCPKPEDESNCPEDCGGEAKGMTEVANPASVKCLEDGGDLEIRNDSEGGQVGYCIFDGGKECEEWSYFRGECQ